MPREKQNKPQMLLQRDLWVGEAIMSARVEYETWTGLLNRQIRVEPEFPPNPVGDAYIGILANYSKQAFLSAVSVLSRGFLEWIKYLQRSQQYWTFSRSEGFSIE